MTGQRGLRQPATHGMQATTQGTLGYSSPRTQAHLRSKLVRPARGRLRLLGHVSPRWRKLYILGLDMKQHDIHCLTVSLGGLLGCVGVVLGAHNLMLCKMLHEIQLGGP